VALWTRLGIAVVVALGLGTGLWAGLQFLVGTDPAIAVTAAVGLATVVGGLEVPWVTQAADSSTPIAKRRTQPSTGTLKGVTSFFTGRVKEWDAIKDAVAAAATPQQIRAAFVIHGMPGVGKSELAQYVAHQLVNNFSDRARKANLDVLPRQVELHGLEGLRRTDPKDALHALLDLDTTDPRRSSMDLDELSAEWRKYLDGKFLILVLDNASYEEQVLPFLPGGSWYVVLVTSRRPLQGLLARGVRSFPLQVLPVADAIQLIKRIVHRPVKEDDQQSIRDIAELCGCQPLAITLGVSTLARKPYISFADRLAQLRATPNQLLAIDEYATRESGGVARSFELSYTQLSDECKLTLRKLSIAPVPNIGVEAASALANLPLVVAGEHLHQLETEALIEEDRDGYHLHDLVRHYARSLTADDDQAENEAAVNRILAYYREAAAYVDSIFTRQPPPPEIEPSAPTVSHHFPDRPSVIKWARSELPNLLACTDYVAREAENNDRREEKAWVVMFASTLAGLLRNEGLWPRSIELQTRAITAAGQIHASLAMANAFHERGFLGRLTGNLQPALADLEQAIAIFREIGDDEAKIGEAHALNTSGVVLDQLKRREESQQRLNSALDIYRRLDNRLGEANILHDQGMAEFFAGQYAQAVQLLGQALTLYQAVNHPLGMAHAHANLARAQRHIGLEREAAENLKAAQTLYHDLGNELGEVTTLIQLGAVLGHSDYRQGVSTLNNAIERSREIGNRLGLVNALYELGALHEAHGDSAGAGDMWMRALQICREHDIHREEGRLVNKLTSLDLLAKPANDDG
jgi:tetratricopeptide (TPR) repeat protein